MAFGFELPVKSTDQLQIPNFNYFWLRISMDRISDSDSEDAGSIPAGATDKADKPAEMSLS
jgi:hypothetical protein